MKNKKLINKLVFSLPVFMFPALVFAGESFADIKGMAINAKGVLSTVYKIVVGLALLFFMWNMGQVILKAGDAKAKEEARNKMIWGVLALFVMFSIGGIITWIGDQFDLPDSGVSINGINI